MELDAIINLSFGVAGSLIAFLLGYWFKKLNDKQEDNSEDLNDIKVDIGGSNERFIALKEANVSAHADMQKEMAKLANEMALMAKTVTSNNMTQQRHTLEIRNLQDQHKIISEELKALKIK